MAWTPVTGIPFQKLTSAGALASGYYLKFYDDNTTTAINMATDSTGDTQLDKCQINSSGYPINGSGGVFVPHIEQAYKIAIYTNATDADNDIIGNAVSVDDLDQFLTGSTSSWVTFSGTPTQTSATTFTLTGDQTSTFLVGTRLRLIDSSTLYGIVTASTYTTLTTVTVVLDSGSLTGSLSAVEISTAKVGEKPISSHAVSHNYLSSGSINRAIFDIFGSLPIDVIGKGADISGATSSQTAIDNAIATGKDIIFPRGTYLVDGINITTDTQSVIFVGEVVLKANVNDAVLFTQSASFARHAGTFTCDPNSKTGVWGMLCGPQDLTQTTTVTQNSNNLMPGIIGQNALEECVVLQCGPDVGGTDSGCFINTFPFCRGRGALRVLWLRDPPNAGGASCNRNIFNDFRCATGGGVASNTGVQIDAGDTNKFYGLNCEGISNGTSPNTTPTGIIVKQASSVNGADNNGNQFFGVSFENCTRDIENANARTSFFGSNHDDSKCLMTATPLLTLGGDDPGSTIQRALGFVQSVATNTNLLDAVELSDIGKKWTTWALNTANVTHQGGASVTSVINAESRFVQLSKFMEFSCRFTFRAANTNDILIDLPAPPDEGHYVTFGNTPAMRFPCQSNDGATDEIVGAYFQSPNKIRITHSSAWDTAAANNRIWLNIRYRVADRVETGTTDSTTANKLADSTQNFTSTVAVGDIVVNLTDRTSTDVTAVDSDTQLSLTDDIMASGDSYEIFDYT